MCVLCCGVWVVWVVWVVCFEVRQSLCVKSCGNLWDLKLDEASALSFCFCVFLKLVEASGNT